MAGVVVRIEVGSGDGHSAVVEVCRPPSDEGYLRIQTAEAVRAAVRAIAPHVGAPGSLAKAVREMLAED